jgi:magnesium-transporting ATPase (P-type)
MAVSFGIKSWIEGGVVAAVIMLNVVVGFFQEYSAEKTMDSLRSLSSPTATVVRDGEAVVVPSGEVVPGDLVEVKMGDTIPADLRYATTKSWGAVIIASPPPHCGNDLLTVVQQVDRGQEFRDR